ncbi:conserved hypothetical protein [Roseibium sp. TrichSKD4]|nr:conserved hypothetical protein [Roseibium sp. TrichSKD4]
MISATGCVSAPIGPDSGICAALSEIKWEAHDADVVSERLARSLDTVLELEKEQGCHP